MTRKEPYLGPLDDRYDNRPVHMKRGWRRKEEGRGVLVGHFRIDGYAAWPGMIGRRGKLIEVFIKNPPVELLKLHEHGECVWPRQNNWWLIHLKRQPRDGKVDSVIALIERMLAESMRLKASAT